MVRTGHYRMWPAFGSVAFAGGFFVLASLGSEPVVALAWVGTGLLGIGMGAGSPVFMLAMQNAYEYMFTPLVDAGFTVFAVRHGSGPRYKQM